MKLVRRGVKIITLFLFSLSSLVFYAQNNLRVKAQHREEEIIIRINPNLLDHQIIENENIKQGSLHGFLNGKGKTEMEKLPGKPFDLPKAKVRKVFPKLTSCDKKSISRQGKIIDMPPFWATFALEKPKNMKFDEFLAAVRSAYPVVLYAHPIYLLEKDVLPNDSLFGEQHSLHSTLYPDGDINMDSAWMMETGKRHIKVGVFDSGIDSAHVDLDVLTGYGYYFGSLNHDWGIDYAGHGTAVAGIIGAKRNNNIGVAGIAGGDGSDSSGVSLLDFKYTYEGGFPNDIEFLSAGIIDAARGIGTYFDWSDFTGGGPECAFMRGYGIHVGNHSYGLLVTVDELPKDSIVGDELDLSPPECDLCKEAFLFSLQNGVVNVVSRGNLPVNTPYPYHLKHRYPTNYHDSWTICVGSSGYDGQWFYGPNNGDPVEKSYFSPLGRQLDLLAPGSATIVSTTRTSKGIAGNTNFYQRFNGTSAAAPHVSGVAALLLSYYNKPCYSNANLDPADVQYILKHSAKDLYRPGYDDSSGWGRLDAYKALKMIEFPHYQIVHPTANPTSSSFERDTVHIYLGSPLSERLNGPLGSQFSPLIEREYQVERYKYTLTYDFSSYLLPTTDVRDVWIRHSETNSLMNVKDTSGFLKLIGTTGQYGWFTEKDTFKIEPMAEIVNFDSINGTIELSGYYYHFINLYSKNTNFSVIERSENFWYPINPLIQQPNMAYSVYLQDVNFTERYDFPCDSLNPLVDTSSVSLNEKYAATHAFALYPNPGTEELNVQIKHVQGENHYICLADASGRVLKKQTVAKHEKTCQLDTKDLQAGIYFVHWYSNKQLITSKKWIKL